MEICQVKWGQQAVNRPHKHPPPPATPEYRLICENYLCATILCQVYLRRGKGPLSFAETEKLHLWPNFMQKWQRASLNVWNIPHAISFQDAWMRTDHDRLKYYQWAVDGEFVRSLCVWYSSHMTICHILQSNLTLPHEYEQIQYQHCVLPTYPVASTWN